MKIGISILITRGFNIWSNGLNQNILFLAQTLRASEACSEVVLINCGDSALPKDQVNLDDWGVRVVSQHEIGDSLDVIIEMGGAVDLKILDLQRARGKKVVWFAIGSAFVSLVEPIIFDKPSFFARPSRCDEIWLLPQHMRFAPMLRTLYHCPVWQVPYLWSPHFIEQRKLQTAQAGFEYGFKVPAQTPLRLAIFEPNISVVKNCVIPMLGADIAYRRNPKAIEHLFTLNTLHMKEHPTMLYLANSLDLVKQHHATFEGRHDIVGFMAEFANAVISHQWDNEQNNLYLDVLWGDYPLIHNSPWIADAGYYYPEFEAEILADGLLDAWQNHARNLVTYRQKSQRIFDAVDPLNSENVSAYADRLLSLANNSTVEGSAP